MQRTFTGRVATSAPRVVKVQAKRALGVAEKSKQDNAELYATFESLLSTMPNIKNEEKITGTVVGIDKRVVYVDIGMKQPAVVPMSELSITAGVEADSILAVDDVREFAVLRSDGPDGSVTLSLKKLEAGLAWERIRQQMESEVTVDAVVVSVNKGGLLVEVGNLRGFLPASQVSPRILKSENLVGSTLKAKFIEVDEVKQRLVLSNKKAMAEIEGTVDINSLSVGDVVSGTVQAVKPYGAFIDLSGLTGLLHVSQVSNDRVSTVEGLFAAGEVVKCMVLSVDKGMGRISLSTSKLEPAPGDMLRDRQHVYERAEEMAKMFKERIAAAELAVRSAEESAAPAGAQ